MEKLRLNVPEKENLMKIIRDKLNATSNINGFTFNKSDMNDYINEITNKENVVSPLLCITSDAYVTMLELIRQSPVEISWHGLVKRDKEKGIYVLYDILIFPQINTATTTTTDETEFAKWQMSLISDMDFPIEELRMHGHSHVNMNVFSSGVDDKYQTDLISKVEDGDFYLFLIMNKKMDICALLYDFEQQILFDTNDIEIKIIDKKNNDIKNKCRKWIAENCKTQAARYPKATYYNSSLILDEEEETVLGYNAQRRAWGGKKNGSK